jgi:hypothetical protein
MAREQSHGFKLNVLSWTLFTEVILDEVIQAREPRDIVHYVREARELRDRYRGYLSMLETEIKAEPWETKLEEEVDKLVRGKIVPEIQRLGEEKRVLWERLFGRLVRTTVQPKYLTAILGLTMIPRVSYWDLLWYATISVAGSKWLSEIVPNAVDFLLERKRTRRHALFFLMNVG